VSVSRRCGVPVIGGEGSYLGMKEPSRVPDNLAMEVRPQART
jgi:hypothetical protein